MLCFIFISILKSNDTEKELNITGSSKTTIKSFDLYKEGKFSSLVVKVLGPITLEIMEEVNVWE